MWTVKLATNKKKCWNFFAHAEILIYSSILTNNEKSVFKFNRQPDYFFGNWQAALPIYANSTA